MKQKLLLKAMLLLCALIAGSSSVWALSYNYNFSSGGTNNSSDDPVTNTWVTSYFTILQEKGSSTSAVANYLTAPRWYKSHEITITPAASVTITQIVINCSGSNNGQDITASTGSVSKSGYNSTWSGSITSSSPLTLTMGSQCRPTSLDVTYVIDNRTAVNITSFTADATTIQIGNTVNTTVAVDQGGWTESYEYESDDTDIATVDTDGKITAVAAGTATITVSLNMNPSDANYKAGATTSKEIEITVVENPVHTATFNINGQTSVQDVAEGSAISFPAVSGLGGLNFLGWTTSAIVGTVTVAPAVLVTSANMGDADIIYYAVFGKTSTVTDVLTRGTTGVTIGSTSYSDWSGKTASSDAVYAGNSAGSNDAIQLRSTSNSGVITTASGGKATKVIVTWNDNTANDRTLNVYGKNTAYALASDLYNNTNQGTLIGTIVKGTSTELTISTDYEYIGVRSASGAMYLSELSITWNTGGDNEYCTSVTTPATITAAEYATFNSAYALDFSATGITVYTATDNKTSVTLNEVASGKVPANTPVVLYKAGADGTAINVPVIASADAIGGTNDLHVSTGTDVEYMYVLAKNPTIGFYPWAGTSNLSAGKVYLQGKASYGAREFIGFGNEATSISTMNVTNETNKVVYDLQGRRVAQPTKGLYIINGKKVVIK